MSKTLIPVSYTHLDVYKRQVDTTDVYPIGRVLFFYVNPEDSENYTDSLYASAADKADEIIGTISCLLYTSMFLSSVVFSRYSIRRASLQVEATSATKILWPL